LPTCKHCHHPQHDTDCTKDGCGCIRFEPVDLAARDARRKLFLVRVAFLTRTGWTSDVEVRVRAQSMTGAAMRGVQQARKAALRPRTRVSQARIMVIAA
jgi:hypothetical protein